MITKKISVLGAGIIGICTAIYLQRDGHLVTLIDSDVPGSGASSGNAGLIQCGAVVPIATPKVIRSVPRMLLDPDQPLVLKWRNLHTLMPYLLRFLHESTPKRMEYNSKALSCIVPHAYSAFKPLIANAGLENMITCCGELHVYETTKAYNDARYAFELRQRRGVRVEYLSIEKIFEMEPALSSRVRHGTFLPEAYLTCDPGRFCRALANQFIADGGNFIRSKVEKIEPSLEDGKVGISLSNNTKIKFDGAVLSFGAFSKSWANELGSPVPLDSERGYNVTLDKPDLAINRAILSGEYRFALSPIGGGIRVAGTAELARVGAPPDYERARRLLPLAQRLLPGLNTEYRSLWMGHRPSTPDSLPIIGRSPVHRNIFFAFGHGHLGLTLGGVTGLLIADVVSGRVPSFDLTKFSAQRFQFRGPKSA